MEELDNKSVIFSCTIFQSPNCFLRHYEKLIALLFTDTYHIMYIFPHLHVSACTFLPASCIHDPPSRIYSPFWDQVLIYLHHLFFTWFILLTNFQLATPSSPKCRCSGYKEISRVNRAVLTWLKLNCKLTFKIFLFLFCGHWISYSPSVTLWAS